jgi:hypothetical protein
MQQHAQQTYVQAAQTGGAAIAHQGYGSKRGGLRNHAYKKRWFVLTEEGLLLYFEHSDSTAPLGAVHLADATLAPHRTDDFKLIIKTRSRDWGLRYADARLCGEWMRALQSTIDGVRERTQPSAMNLLHLDEDRLLRALARETAAPLTSVSVTCFSWNMGARLPAIRELAFLRAHNKCGILAFGLQEYQAATSSIIAKQHEKNQLPPLEIWNAMLQSTLGPSYSLAASKSMGGMALSVFLHADVAGLVGVPSSGSVPCGIGNVLYNKGAVGISLDVKGTRFSFVSAHLPAHHGKVSERNIAYRRICDLIPGALAQGSKHAAPRGGHADEESEFSLDEGCVDAGSGRASGVGPGLGGGSCRLSSAGHGHHTSLEKGYKKISKLWGKSASDHQQDHQASLAMFDQVNLDPRNGADWDEDDEDEDDEDEAEIGTGTGTNTSDSATDSPAPASVSVSVSASVSVPPPTKTEPQRTDRGSTRPAPPASSSGHRQSAAFSLKHLSTPRGAAADPDAGGAHDRYFFFGDLNYRWV